MSEANPQGRGAAGIRAADLQPPESELHARLTQAAEAAEADGDREMAVNLRDLAEREADPHYQMTRAVVNAVDEIGSLLYDHFTKLGEEGRALRLIQDELLAAKHNYGYGR